MILENVIYKPLPKDQYLSGSKINSICLHHTAGGSAQSTINWWGMDKSRIATHFVVDRDGTVYQTVPLDCWAYHLYVASPGNKIESKYKRMKHDITSLGIEICSWGQLVKKNGKLYNYVDKVIPIEKACELEEPHKGYTWFEAYTPEQIKAVETLLKQLVDIYKIPLKDSYDDIFDIQKDALDMKPGIYSHNSYRTDKVDIAPQEPLLKMLNSLHG